MRIGKSGRRGYTLIEIIIVMTIMSILLSAAVPLYTRVVQRTKESVLRNNLFSIRNVIDEYTYDKQKAPQSLQDLVTRRYRDCGCLLEWLFYFCAQVSVPNLGNTSIGAAGSHKSPEEARQCLWLSISI